MIDIRQRKLFCLAGILLFCCSSVTLAAGVGGATLSLIWILPFLGILLSIAIFPIVMPSIWHHHFGKIVACWIAAFLIPYSMSFGIDIAWDIMTHALIAEYLPFMVLLFTLYTISGGILVWGHLHGTPKLNTAILALGSLLASVMGTTGAAMLCIRPLIKANKDRQHNVHIVIFFIFLVANIGGGMTPLGDPPLFIGFLKGVSFAWTIQHMWLPVLFATTILLTVFYCLDRYYYKKEIIVLTMPRRIARFRLFGAFNFILIFCVVIAVLFSGIWRPGITLSILGTPIALEDMTRDIVLLILAAISLRLTPKQIRAGNAFNWVPIAEVAKLFAGIFITIAPVITILHAGKAGGFSAILHRVSTAEGEPIDVMYFWIVGLLSSFLDNAPTYLVFFNLAHGDPVQMMGPLSSTLLAISMGAVFMGANTYIGNAPNFMVKTIAEQEGVNMPGFFGYMRWSCCILIPLFVLLTLLCF